MLIRPSSDDDLDAIGAIYAHHVLHGTGTFELEPPPPPEMARRRADVLAKGLPWLVAETDSQVVGFAYASPFRPRPAYRFSVEDSVYLAPGALRRGIGRALLAELMARCTDLGMRQMLAVIGDSSNQGSIRLHASMGFVEAGALTHAGWKFDRWLDVVFMQRPLGLGAGAAPADHR